MTAMFWNWQGGYRFIRAEVALVSGGVGNPGRETAARLKDRANSMRSSGIPVHLGSTGCASGEPTKAPCEECKHPNRVMVSLPEFDPAKDVVIFDLGV